jgi:hypothetical protein
LFIDGAPSSATTASSSATPGSSSVASSSTFGSRSGGAKTATSSPLYGEPASSDHNPSNVPTPGMIGAQNSAFVRIGNDSNAMGSDPTPSASSIPQDKYHTGPCDKNYEGYYCSQCYQGRMLWKSPIDQAAEKLCVALRNAMKRNGYVAENDQIAPLNPSSLNYGIDDVKQMLIQKYGTEGLMLLDAAESQNMVLQLENRSNYGIHNWSWWLYDKNRDANGDPSPMIAIAVYDRSFWTPLGFTKRNLGQSAEALKEALEGSLGGKTGFFPGFFRGLDFSAPELQFIAKHPDIFADADVINASKLSAQNEAFANLMGHALDQRAIDKMVEIGVLTGLKFCAAAPGFFGGVIHPGYSKRIALGVETHIDDFARMNGAQSWKQFAKSDPMAWKARFMELINDPNSEIFFNLKGVDVWAGVTRAATGKGGATDWELLQIMENKGCWSRIRWMMNGISVPNPFD